MRSVVLSCFLFVAGGMAALAQGPNTGVAVQIQPRTGNGQFCVDARRDTEADGTPVFIYQCRGSENQRWTISSSVNNQHAIIGTGGYCLDVRGTNSTSNGTPVQLWKCHFGENQRFATDADGRIKEVRSGKCLIATAAKDGAPLVLDTCKNSQGELFWFASRTGAGAKCGDCSSTARFARVPGGRWRPGAATPGYEAG